MPCGPLDKRRIGHRCLTCKRTHSKCNGKRPCAACIARGLQCVESKPPATLAFMHHHTAATVPKPLIQESWWYMTAYFQSFGSMPQVACLRSALISTLGHHDENVNQTLCVMGCLYASRNPHILRVSDKQKRTMLAVWEQQKSACASQLQAPQCSNFASTLLCAVLLAAIELLVYETGESWWAWLQAISVFLKAHAQLKDPSLYNSFERELITIFQFNNLLGTLAGHGPPLEPRPSLPSSSRQPNSDHLQQEESHHGIVGKMLDTVYQCAVLRDRATKWTEEAKRLPTLPYDGQEATAHRVNGFDIVCSSSTLQSTIISDLLDSSKSRDYAVQCMAPNYYCALTFLSQMLQNSAWQSLDCELPVMPACKLQQQAALALGSIETMVAQAGLELVLYLPMVEFIGLELRTHAERIRMLNFVKIVKERGFKIAGEYTTDLIEDWKTAEPWLDEKTLLDTSS